MQAIRPASSDLPGRACRHFACRWMTLIASDLPSVVEFFRSAVTHPGLSDTNLMMLSTLWGLSRLPRRRGAPDFPVEIGFTASMARDLYPDCLPGFSVSFRPSRFTGQVSANASFHNGARDDDDRPSKTSAATFGHLCQRLFIVIRERNGVSTFPGVPATARRPNTRQFLNQLPFSSVKIPPRSRPNLDDPTTSPSRSAATANACSGRT